MQEEPIRVGEVVDGKYQLEKVLGRGMMGVVVSQARFSREACVASKLTSVHVFLAKLHLP